MPKKNLFKRLKRRFFSCEDKNLLIKKKVLLAGYCKEKNLLNK